MTECESPTNAKLPPCVTDLDYKTAGALKTSGLVCVAQGRGHPVVTQSDNQGDGLPMALEWTRPIVPAGNGPKSQQAGARGGLVDEHQSGEIKQALLANPVRSAC
jgi:hypothetical protein